MHLKKSRFETSLKPGLQRFFCLGLSLGLCLATQGESGNLPQKGAENGKAKEQFEALVFTTSEYEKEALDAMLNEANQVAKVLLLPEVLPITKTDVKSRFVAPPNLAQLLGTVGSISTSNYTYYFSIAGKFSFLEISDLERRRVRTRKESLFPLTALDTNSAIVIATQTLAKVGIDVKTLNDRCRLSVDVYRTVKHGEQMFVPIYTLTWSVLGQRGVDAFWELSLLDKTIWQFRVTKSDYILRSPLALTNLTHLLTPINVQAKAAVSSNHLGRNSRPADDNPTDLARVIASADRIVCANILCLEGASKINFTVSGERAKTIVKAVISAKKLQAETNTTWDWELQFFTSAKHLAVVRFHEKVFLADKDEFADESGVLERLYKEALAARAAADFTPPTIP